MQINFSYKSLTQIKALSKKQKCIYQLLSKRWLNIKIIQDFRFFRFCTLLVRKVRYQDVGYYTVVQSTKVKKNIAKYKIRKSQKTFLTSADLRAGQQQQEAWAGILQIELSVAFELPVPLSGGQKLRYSGGKCACFSKTEGGCYYCGRLKRSFYNFKIRCMWSWGKWNGVHTISLLTSTRYGN